MQNTTNYSKFRPSISGVTTGYSLNSSYNNSKCISTLVNTEIWKDFLDTRGYGDYVIGAPTLEMWVASWNAKGNTKLYCNNTSTYGYYVGTSSNPTDSIVNNLSTNDDLYFPVKSNNVASNTAFGNWFSTPCGNSADYMLCVDFKNSRIARCRMGVSTAGSSLRPIIRLKNTVCARKSGNTWNLY